MLEQPLPIPLLSICIPTFNRADWLRASLRAWLPQIVDAGSLVELLVSDNCSEDDTHLVVEQARQWGGFRYNRNDTNIGGNPNFHKCVQLARGKFVWVVGDDDLPLPRSVEKVVTSIQQNKNVNFYYVNHGVLLTSEIPNENNAISDLTSDATAVNPLMNDCSLEQLKNLMPGDYTCFTSIYTSIMPRDCAIDAFAPSIGLEPFSNIASVSSHALYIADHFLDKPAYYIGSPCLAVSADISWPQYQPLFFLKILPGIYDYFEDAGVSKEVMDKYRKRLMLLSRFHLWKMVTDKTTVGRQQFSLKAYALKHWRLPEFYLLCLKCVLSLFIPGSIRQKYNQKLAERRLASLRCGNN